MDRLTATSHRGHAPRRLIAKRRGLTPRRFCRKVSNPPDMHQPSTTAEKSEAERLASLTREQLEAILPRQTSERAKAAVQAELDQRPTPTLGALRGTALNEEQRAAKQAAEADALAADRLDDVTRPVVLRDLAEPIPCAVTRDDGHPLLYAERVSFLVGDPGGGKSWVAAVFAAINMGNCGRVLWIDNEDSPQAFAERTWLLGVYHQASDPEQLRFVDQELLEDPIAIAGASRWLQDRPTPLVVIDTAQATGAPSDGADISEWWAKTIRPWQKAGSTVVVIDHRPKRSADRAPGPIGSVHKLSRLDGACLAVNGHPWTRREGGRLTLKIEKDRMGAIGKRNAIAADMAGTYDAHGGFLITIEAHRDDTPQADQAQRLSDRITDHFHEHPEPITENKLAQAVTGNNRALKQIIKGMVASGQLTTDRGQITLAPVPRND